ncbi:MAG TPA: nuclear transport factor 2 family protein [Candidatus Saccharimonadia bacterium]|jgi:ketosteroid isomerase-like protein
MSRHAQLAKDFYLAFAKADRDFVDNLLAPDFTFSAPPDPLLDRNGFFERCWPGAGSRSTFNFVRLIEHSDEVVVTYEATKLDGTAGRNTEVLTFDGDKVCRSEVYFGWDVK